MKNVSFYELPESTQQKILNADMIVVNSKKWEIYPISTDSTDKVIRIGEQFKFWSNSSNVIGNTTTISEIIGDSWSQWSWKWVKYNSIKDEYAENI